MTTYGVSLLVHLITLPVEFDASFGKALPMLKNTGKLSEEDLKSARKILWAAAMTYVAGALLGFVNIFRIRGGIRR